MPASDLSSLPQLRSWEDLVAEPDAWRVRWTRRKRVPRMLEKLQRAYGGEAARLGDVCREAIVFDSAMDLIRCLEAIQADQEAHVVRIKNRMHPAFDGRWSGSFRYAPHNACSKATCVHNATSTLLPAGPASAIDWQRERCKVLRYVGGSH